VIESHTDTITLIETVKSPPVTDTLNIVSYLDREVPIPVYYKDKNWEAMFTLKNDSLIAQIKYLSDSLEHKQITKTIDTFKSEKINTEKSPAKRKVNWTIVLSVLGLGSIGGVLLYLK
jgi:hypothetical protein